jgi:hypothetical protein
VNEPVIVVHGAAREARPPGVCSEIWDAAKLKVIGAAVAAEAQPRITIIVYRDVRIDRS